MLQRRTWGPTGEETTDIPVGPDDSTTNYVLQGFVLGAGEGNVELQSLDGSATLGGDRPRFTHFCRSFWGLTGQILEGSDFRFHHIRAVHIVDNAGHELPVSGEHQPNTQLYRQ